MADLTSAPRLSQRGASQRAADARPDRAGVGGKNSPSASFPISYEKTEPSEPTQSGSFDTDLNRLRTDEPSAGCENADTTANGRKPNAINDSDLVAEALKQVKKVRSAFGNRE
jgi:hypothetical protein